MASVLNEGNKWENITRGSVSQSRILNVPEKKDRWEIVYSVPEAAHHDIGQFGKKLRERISSALGTDHGITIGNVVTDDKGKGTITATLVDSAFQAMEIANNEFEERAFPPNGHGR